MFKAGLKRLWFGLNGIQDLMGSVPRDMVNKKTTKTDDRNQSPTIKNKRKNEKNKGNMISLSRMSTTN